MELKNIHNIYFLGIGGIGMSALARYFHQMGYKVSGYDLSCTSITRGLEDKGITIHYEPSVLSITGNFLKKDETLVVLTPAVPDEHPELQYFKKNDFTIMKRAEVLGMIFNQKKGIAIAGTHGKTSVTSMTAHIMSEAPLGTNAFLGGILKNTNSNLMVNESSPWVVAEADEYDRSFLQLNPNIAVITWIDSDHLDIYNTSDAIHEAFTEFAMQIKPDGKLILKKDIELILQRQDITVCTYAYSDTEADFHAADVRLNNGLYTFDINTPEGLIKDIRLQYPGLTNIENAVAAAAATWCAGVSREKIGKSLSGFLGVKRRFDIQFDNGKCIYIDDYAHHPRELDAFISSVRNLYAGRKITGVFQPHLYSRTRDFAPDFAESLSKLDEVILLDIYPARERPMRGVTSEIIFNNITVSNKELCRKGELLDLVRRKKFDVLLTMGAGDIDRFVEPIRKIIEGR